MEYRVEFEDSKAQNFFEECGHTLEDLKWNGSSIPERLSGNESGYFKYTLKTNKAGEKYIYIWVVRRNRMI